MHSFLQLAHADHDLKPISVRVPTACRMIGIGRAKFYQLIAAGEIEISKVGATTLIPVASLEALIARNTRRAA